MILIHPEIIAYNNRHSHYPIPGIPAFGRHKIRKDGINVSQLKGGFYQQAITCRGGVWGLSLGGVVLSTAVRQ